MIEKRWNVAELIDLEFFLNQDVGEDLAALAVRDRELCVGFSAAEQPEASASALMRHWLAGRKSVYLQNGAAAFLPGKIWQELFWLFAAASLLLGLSSGAGLAFSLLTYSGVEPINVAVYFTVLVALQPVLLLLLAGAALCGQRRGSGCLLQSSLLCHLIARLFSVFLGRLIIAAGQKAGSRIAAETKLKWAAHAVSFRQLQQRYGFIFLWPFFLIGQTFGVSFNLGALAATLLKVIGSDLAFGWQSTLQVKAESVHAVVSWVSLPWSWLPAASPSLAGIEGSRLILKDGIHHLASRDLTAWWPFLCLSVCCYGLLPRLLLLIAGVAGQQQAISRLSFEQGRFRQLIHRMRTPSVSTAARAEQSQERAAAGSAAQQPLPVFEAALPIAGNAVVLLPDELAAACPCDALAEHIRRRTGYRLCQTMSFWTLDKSEEEELIALQDALKRHGCQDVLIIHEAWQPPVQELLNWLNLLRLTVGPQAVILLALIGKPGPDTMLTPVRSQDMQIWQQKLTAVNDQGLQLLALVKS